jgi:hypothetical protein
MEGVARKERGGAMRDRDHDEAMAELYAKDPELAVEMINALLEDG